MSISCFGTALSVPDSAQGQAGDHHSVRRQSLFGSTRVLLLLAALPLCMLSLGAMAQSVPPTIDCGTSAAVFNTAYDIGSGGIIAPGAGVTDPHWESSPDGVTWSPSAVQGRQAGSWAVSPFGNADWISSPFTPPNSSPVFYRYQFNLAPDFPLANFALQFAFFVDDRLQKVSVNGVTTVDLTGGNFSAGGGGYTQASGTTLVINPGNWVNGLNSLTIQTFNDGPPSGLMVQATSDTTCPAHVGIIKTADRSTALNAGDQLTYSVVVSNTGNGSAPSASNVVVSDPLPTGMASGTWTCTQTGTVIASANCPASGTLPLNEPVDVLPAGSALTYSISAQVVASDVPASITNTAQVALQIGDLCADGSSPRCTASVTNIQVGNITISKTVVGSAAPGPWQFTLSTATAGCSIPAGSASASTEDGSGGTATFANLPAASSTSPTTLCAYDIAETAQIGWVMNAGNSSTLSGVNATRAGSTPINIENDQQTGSIVVTKTVNGFASSSPWQFIVTSATPGCTIPAGVNPAATPSGASGTTASFDGLAIYSSTVVNSQCAYSIVETAQLGYQQSSAALVDIFLTADTSTAVSIVNSQLYGSLVVEKRVSGGSANYVGSFQIGVACTFNGQAVAGIVAAPAGNVTASAAAPGSISFGNIPIGSLCSVSEATPASVPNYDWATPSINPGSLPISSTAAPAKATVTNALARQTTSLTITKSIADGPTAGLTATFGFSVDCSASGDGSYPATVTLAGQATNTGVVAGLPVGAVCSIGETSLPGAPNGYAWAATPNPVGPLTLSPIATANAAGFTNTLVVPNGKLTINKTVVGGSAPKPFQFTISATGGNAAGCQVPTSVLSIAGSGGTASAVVPSFSSADGAACTYRVAESPQTGWTQTTPGAALPVTSLASTDTANFTNTRDVGSITVMKTLVGGGIGSDAWSFTVAASGANAAGCEIPIATATTPAAGGIGKFDALPAYSTADGAACLYEVAETGQVNWQQTTPPRGPVVGLNVGDTASFTNTRESGDLTVTKHVAGFAAGTVQVSGLFGFTASCDVGGPFLGSITMNGGADASATITGIPAGANCVVSETSAPAAPAGYQWNAAATAYTTNPVQISANAAAALTITNMLTGPNQLDPPFASKSVSVVDAQTLQWQIVEINSQNSTPLAIDILDPLPSGLSWIADSISCQAQGSSIVAVCSIVGNQVKVSALLGPDAGASAETAQNALTIKVQTRFVAGSVSVTNIAQTYYDASNDGTPVAGPITASATYTFSQPAAPALPVAVPVDTRWLLWMLVLVFLIGAGASLLQRRSD